MNCRCGVHLVDFVPVYNHVPALDMEDVFYQRPVLARGFVDAKKRHASGLRWYVPADNPKRLSPELRSRPFVITCHCGISTKVDMQAPRQRVKKAAEEGRFYIAPSADTDVLE